MGATEEIFESFFVKLSQESLFKDSFIEDLKRLLEAGKVDQVTLRGLIEEAYPDASTD